jgi:hypothetical protein
MQQEKKSAFNNPSRLYWHRSDIRRLGDEIVGPMRGGQDEAATTPAVV